MKIWTKPIVPYASDVIFSTEFSQWCILVEKSDFYVTFGADQFQAVMQKIRHAVKHEKSNTDEFDSKQLIYILGQ